MVPVMQMERNPQMVDPAVVVAAVITAEVRVVITMHADIRAKTGIPTNVVVLADFEVQI